MEPASSDDWEVLETNSSHLEEGLLNQVTGGGLRAEAPNSAAHSRPVFLSGWQAALACSYVCACVCVCVCSCVCVCRCLCALVYMYVHA